MISTLQPGTYSFGVPDWSCQLSVTVVDYPFTALLDVPSATPRKQIGMLTIAAASAPWAIPGAEVRLIPGAGHVPNTSHPAEYAMALTSFLSKHA